MQADLFLQKLSEVCKWEWYDCDSRRKTKDLYNRYPQVVSYPARKCDTCIKPCNFKIDRKIVDNRRVFFERCASCKQAKTKTGEWRGYPCRSPRELDHFLRENVLPD